MEAVVWGTVKLEVRARVNAVVCRAEEHCRVGHRRVLALELLLKVGVRRANEVFEPSEKRIEPTICQAEAIAYQIEGLSRRFEPDGEQVSVKVPASATNCVTRVAVVCVRAWCGCAVCVL